MLSLVYYGLSLNSTDMGVNAYLAFCFLGVVEMGACILAMPCLNILGRRLTLFGTMMPGGVACIAAIFIRKSQSSNLIFVHLAEYNSSRFLGNHMICTAMN